MPIIRSVIDVTLGWTSFAAAALCATTRYQATGTFTTSAFPSQIAVGDTFIVDFSYDDGATDIDARTLGGRFPNAVTSLQFKLRPGSAGNYAGGVGSAFAPIDTFDGIGPILTGIPDRFYLRVLEGSFGQVGGFPFGELLLVLDDNSHRSNINDLGVGQTLRSLLGGNLQLEQFPTASLRISATDKRGGSAQGVITSLTAVPELRLQISVVGQGNLRITWPSSYGPCLLETAATLLATDWQPVNGVVQSEGELNFMIVEAGTSHRLFRLKKL